MVCKGQTSRIDVAKEILSILELKDKIKINAVSSEFFMEEYFAERPPSERLINMKLKLRGLDNMRSWKYSLKEYLENYFKDFLI